MNGTVAGVEFLGEVSRLRVSYGLQTVLAQISSRDAARWNGRVGETVRLTFEPEDASIIPPGRTLR